MKYDANNYFINKIKSIVSNNDEFNITDEDIESYLKILTGCNLKPGFIELQKGRIYFYLENSDNIHFNETYIQKDGKMIIHLYNRNINVRLIISYYRGNYSYSIYIDGKDKSINGVHYFDNITSNKETYKYYDYDDFGIIYNVALSDYISYDDRNFIINGFEPDLVLESNLEDDAESIINHLVTRSSVSEIEETVKEKVSNLKKLSKRYSYTLGYVNKM